MVLSRPVAASFLIMLAASLVSPGGLARAGEAAGRAETETSRAAASRSPPRFQGLREWLRARRAARRIADEERPTVDRPVSQVRRPAPAAATGERVATGPATTGRQLPLADKGSASRADAGTRRDATRSKPAAPSPFDVASPWDPGILPSAFMMQGAGTQNAPTPGLTPDAIASEQPPTEVGPDGVPSAGPRSSFGGRLRKAYFGREEGANQEAETEEASPGRRTSLPPPFAPAPPFPFAEHTGPNIGVNDTSVYPFMKAVYEGPDGDWWKKNRLKFYGWADPSYNASTSRFSNIPMSYDIVPNHVELSQLIWILERPLDTVQQDHFDWGFKFTSLYGMDYRYTTAKGWFSDQLLKHNSLYGYDPLQLYLDLYCPGVAQGMVIRIGRYISPIDIEAQLSPENYLYTHSLMYTYDPYTFTGVQFITLLAERLTLQMGVHAGNDMAPWTTSSQPNGEFLMKWVSASGGDALFGGLDSIGQGDYKNGHDDLQVLAGTWTHKFTDRFHTLTEAYFIWERDARVGGTIIGGPPQPYFPEVGPGAFLPGLSYSIGAVNYTAYALSNRSYMVWRNDVLDDPRGYRTGFPGAVFETTLGWVYHITPWCISRPEVRFDWTSGQKAYDNGTRREQFTLSWDIIVRF